VSRFVNKLLTFLVRFLFRGARAKDLVDPANCAVCESAIASYGLAAVRHRLLLAFDREKHCDENCFGTAPLVPKNFFSRHRHDGLRSEGCLAAE
jgi:hypothetical protein